MTFAELSAEEQADPEQFLLAAFFSPTDASQAAGRAYLKRLAARTTDRDLPVSPRTAAAQLHAIREWGAVPASDRYATLKNIKHPTLVVHGTKDIVVQPVNAFILGQHLPNAQLIMYPDSSHGAQYQHADLFLKHAKLFLSTSQTTQQKDKALVLEAFDTLFNRRDYAAAERFWSPGYIQHSAHIAPGRAGLFNLVRSLPATLKYEPGVIVANGDFVIVHGRFSGFGAPANWIAADILRIEDGILVEHWDVIQDEATEEQSKSKAPMFGDSFPVFQGKLS
jgi:predicted SnoaL-like aldol condensation-catalyzing enzyme